MTVEAMTVEEARALTEAIRASKGVHEALINQAWEARIWTVLGHESWAAYLAAEDLIIRMPSEQRRRRASAMRELGMSGRAIGAVLGVAEGTVRNDLSTAQNYAVAESNQPPTITGLDGRNRENRPRREPTEPAVLPVDLPIAVAEQPGAVHGIRQIYSSGSVTYDLPSAYCSLENPADLIRTVKADLEQAFTDLDRVLLPTLYFLGDTDRRRLTRILTKGIEKLEDGIAQLQEREEQINGTANSDVRRS